MKIKRIVPSPLNEPLTNAFNWFTYSFSGEALLTHAIDGIQLVMGDEVFFVDVTKDCRINYHDSQIQFPLYATLSESFAGTAKLYIRFHNKIDNSNYLVVDYIDYNIEVYKRKTKKKVTVK